VISSPECSNGRRRGWPAEYSTQLLPTPTYVAPAAAASIIALHCRVQTPATIRFAIKIREIPPADIRKTSRVDGVIRYRKRESENEKARAGNKGKLATTALTSHVSIDRLTKRRSDCCWHRSVRCPLASWPACSARPSSHRPAMQWAGPPAQPARSFNSVVNQLLSYSRIRSFNCRLSSEC